MWERRLSIGLNTIESSKTKFYQLTKSLLIETYVNVVRLQMKLPT